MKRISLVMWPLLFCMACSSNEDIVSFHEVSSLNALVNKTESVKLIPLQTDGEHLLGSPVLLNRMVDGFILSDITNQNIFRYSSDGGFLNEIGNHGRGPGEYMNIKSVQVIGTEVLVSSSNKCLRYSASGECLGETVSQDFGEQSIKTNDNFLTYWGYGSGRGYRMGLLDSSGSMVRKLLPSEEKVIHFSPNTPIFTWNGDEAFIADSYSPTILKYTEGGQLSSYLTIDFGKYAIPASFFNQNDAFAAQKELMSRDFALVCSYWESDKLKMIDAIIQKRSGPEKYQAIQDGSDWQWFSGGVLEKDPFAGSLKWVEGNVLYYLLDASILERFPKELLPLVDNQEVLEQVSPTDNYVIAAVTLKD